MRPSRVGLALLLLGAAVRCGQSDSRAEGVTCNGEGSAGSPLACEVRWSGCSDDHVYAISCDAMATDAAQTVAWACTCAVDDQVEHSFMSGAPSCEFASVDEPCGWTFVMAPARRNESAGRAGAVTDAGP